MGVMRYVGNDFDKRVLRTLYSDWPPLGLLEPPYGVLVQLLTERTHFSGSNMSVLSCLNHPQNPRTPNALTDPQCLGYH
jgi:hypothetical protein